MTDFTNKLAAYERGELCDDQIVELFQHLVDTGLAWTLQGSYGRTAVLMIQAGLVTPDPVEVYGQPARPVTEPVEIVAYGDEVHLYESGDPAAEIVHTVAIGANLDAVRAVVTVERWLEQVLPALPDAAQVHDHR